MSESSVFVGHRGLRSFRDEVTASLVPQEIVADRGRDFAARVSMADVGSMKVLDTTVSPLRARRRGDADSQDSSVFILYAVSGAGELAHRRGVEPIVAGTTLVIPASEGFDVLYARDSRLIFVAVPGDLVRTTYARLQGPIRSVSQGPVGRAVTSSLAHIPDEEDAASPAAVRTVVELIASVSSAHSMPTLRARAERLIEENLGDLRLGVGFLSARLGVSARTLERAFNGEGVASAIRQRRLEVAAGRLRAHPSASVSSIAADLGFGSASRFSAHFRERYAVSPREWRS